MGLAPVFEAGEGVQLDAVDGPENALLNVGIGLFQLPQQHLHLLALALPDAVAGSIPGLGEAASALQKFQMVVVSPGNDGILVDAVQRADQLHTGEILAMELGRHGLDLGAVKQSQERGLNDIGEVVAQGDLIAAQLLRLGIQAAPAHPGAEIAGVLVHLNSDIENIAFKDGDGNAQQLRIGLDEGPVGGIVARVHHQKGQVKGLFCVLLKLLHELCQHHGVFPTGDAHSDMVPGRYQLIPLDGGDEGIP